jgi:hypothetical protein
MDDDHDGLLARGNGGLSIKDENYVFGGKSRKNRVRVGDLGSSQGRGRSGDFRSIEGVVRRPASSRRVPPTAEERTLGDSGSLNKLAVSRDR